MPRFLNAALLSFTSLLLLPSAEEEPSDEIIEEAKLAGESQAKTGKLVPVPIPVSNPTFGVGLQAVLMYLHPGAKSEADNNEKKSSYNTTSGLVGMYTDTDSWFVGAFHDQPFKKDRIRMSAFVGSGEFNLKYYGIGDSPILSENPLKYSFEMNALFLKGLYRLREGKPAFAGALIRTMKSDITFQLDQIHPELPSIRGQITSTGLGPILSRDTRDDNYSPRSGSYAEIKYLHFNEGFGSDANYNKMDAFYNYYYNFLNHTNRTNILALRAAWSRASEDAPFYELAFLDMRGFARGRYTDASTMSVHCEWRYQFAKRWGHVLFAEYGRFGKNFSDYFDNRAIYTAGAGLRYQVTADKRMNLSLDVAISTDESAWYIQVGEAY